MGPIRVSSDLPASGLSHYDVELRKAVDNPDCDFADDASAKSEASNAIVQFVTLAACVLLSARLGFVVQSASDIPACTMALFMVS